ncbi:hypothetical protein F4805DRAFT_414029 [Annulohypoxylon moriforme]|nr:hypothetical protein F4805DRAFT_414029 [Annulohypoxylon moriforme]
MRNCTAVGNADMYGLGIRLGFYLTWYAYLLAKFVVTEEAQSIHYANCCFVLASTVASSWQIVRGALTYFDIIVILILYLGYVFNFVPALSSWWTARCMRTTEDIGFNIVLWSGGVGPVFFWLLSLVWSVREAVNIQKLNHCELYTFLHGIFFFYVVLIVLAETFEVPRMLMHYKRRILGKWTESILLRRYTLLQPIFAVFITIATETTILLYITGVNDLGTISQLIPLLVGLGVMGRVLFVAIYNVSGEPSNRLAAAFPGFFRLFRRAPELPVAA